MNERRGDGFIDGSIDAAPTIFSRRDAPLPLRKPQASAAASLRRGAGFAVVALGEFVGFAAHDLFEARGRAIDGDV